MQVVILSLILDIAHAAAAGISRAEVANVSIIQKEEEDGEWLYCTTIFHRCD